MVTKVLAIRRNPETGELWFDGSKKAKRAAGEDGDEEDNSRGHRHHSLQELLQLYPNTFKFPVAVPSSGGDTDGGNPTRYPFYFGRLNSQQAFRLLSNRPEGTFLLRTNEEGQLRLSIRAASGNPENGSPLGSAWEQQQQQGPRSDPVVSGVVSDSGRVCHIPIAREGASASFVVGEHRFQGLDEVIQAYRKTPSCFQIKHELLATDQGWSGFNKCPDLSEQGGQPFRPPH